MLPLKGFDVSDRNGNVDWDKAKADGYQFAMIRAGYGSDIPSQDDKQFARNVSEAERVGIPWGAYLYSYALTVEQAKSERDHMLRLLKGKKPKYPVAFDMEDADGYKAKHGMPTNDVLVQICDTFLNDVEAKGYYAVLYASKNWLDNQLNSPKLDRYNKWVAQWSPSCTYSKKYCMWQYTNQGQIGGQLFDLDYCYTDFASTQTVQPAVKPQPVPAGITGWKKENGVWYYYVNGVKKTNAWIKYKDNWYYVKADGSMAQGWIQYNKKWYFLNPTPDKGEMLTGWLTDKGKKYYLDPQNGDAYIGKHTIDGKTYQFAIDCSLIG